MVPREKEWKYEEGKWRSSGRVNNLHKTTIPYLNYVTSSSPASAQITRAMASTLRTINGTLGSGKMRDKDFVSLKVYEKGILLSFFSICAIHYCKKWG